MLKLSTRKSDKLAGILAPYRGAVPTVDPLRDRHALSARIAAAAVGMTVEQHREHCRGIVRAHSVDTLMEENRARLAADIRAERLAAGGAR